MARHQRVHGPAPPTRYNDKREAKKKAKKQKGKDLTPADLKLQAQEEATRARFGETVGAPLKVRGGGLCWRGA